MLKRVDSVPMVAVATYCKSGSLQDPDEATGQAAFFSRLFFQGSSRYPTPEAVQEAILGPIHPASAWACLDQSLAIQVVPPALLAAALQVQSDAVRHPALEQGQIQVQFQALSEEFDLQRRSGSFRSCELLHGLVFRKHRLGRLRLSLANRLKEQPRSEQLEAWKRHFRPENLIISVVGNFETDAVLKSLIELYGAVEGPSVPRPGASLEELQNATRLVDELCPGSALAHLKIGFPLPGAMESDHHPLEVFRALVELGLLGRLSRRLEPSRILASAEWTATGGLLALSAAVEPARLQAVEEAIFEALHALNREPFSLDEVAQAKSLLRMRFLARQQRPHEHARTLARFEALGGHHLLDVWLTKLQSVTAEDLEKVCQVYLQPHRASVVQCRPKLDASAPTSLRGLVLAIEKATGANQTLPSVRWKSSGGEVQSTRIPGGPSLLLQNTRKGGAVSIVALYAGGRWDETPERQGWTRLLLESIAEHGYGRRLGKLGCSPHRFATRDDAGLAIQCMPSDFKLASTWFFQLLARPEFTEQSLRQAQDQARQARERKEPAERCLELLCEAMWGEHSYSRPSAWGASSNLASVTPELLEPWGRSLLRRDRLVICVVGDLEADALLERAFEVWTQDRGEKESLPAAPEPSSQGKSLEAHLPLPGCLQMLGLPACSAAAPERVGLVLLQQALADPAWGLGARLGALAGGRISNIGPIWGRLAGALGVAVTSPAELAEELRERVAEAILELSREPMPEEVLARAREAVLARHQMRFQSPGAQAVLAARHQLWGLGPEERQRLPESIWALDRERLHDSTRKWLEPRAMCSGRVQG